MLMTLADTFMTATRMDGFAHAGNATAEAPRLRLPAPSLAARAVAVLRRLVH